MSTSPRIGYVELQAGQAIPETTVNLIGRYLEAFANMAFFKSRTTVAQPVSPADGDCYLLTASPTGTNWAGHANAIALFINTAWVFLTAKNGFTAVIGDESYTMITYNGAAWVAGGAAANEATDSQVWTGTDTATRVSPRRVQSSSAPQAVAYAATVTLDLNTGFSFDIAALTGNLTLANPTNAKAGQSGRIRLVQDATGGRTLTVGGNWKFAGGTPALSTGANVVDIISYHCRSATEIEATLSKAFA